LLIDRMVEARRRLLRLLFLLLMLFLSSPMIKMPLPSHKANWRHLQQVLLLYSLPVAAEQAKMKLLERQKKHQLNIEIPGEEGFLVVGVVVAAAAAADIVVSIVPELDGRIFLAPRRVALALALALAFVVVVVASVVVDVVVVVVVAAAAVAVVAAAADIAVSIVPDLNGRTFLAPPRVAVAVAVAVLAAVNTAADIVATSVPKVNGRIFLLRRRRYAVAVAFAVLADKSNPATDLIKMTTKTQENPAFFHPNFHSSYADWLLSDPLVIVLRYSFISSRRRVSRRRPFFVRTCGSHEINVAALRFLCE